MRKRRPIKGARNPVRRVRGVEIPVNLEKIILRAATEEEFRARLFEDAAAATADVDLTPSERAMLGAIPRPALMAMISRYRPEHAGRSKFARNVAAAMAGSMIISMSACGDDQTRGSNPDVPDSDTYTDTRDDPDSVMPTGIWPDMPDIPDVYEDPDVPDIADEDITEGDPDEEDPGEETDV